MRIKHNMYIMLLFKVKAPIIKLYYENSQSVNSNLVHSFSMLSMKSGIEAISCPSLTDMMKHFVKTGNLITRARTESFLKSTVVHEVKQKVNII